MVELVETKQSRFYLLFLAIMLSILANIIWAGQNIDKFNLWPWPQRVTSPRKTWIKINCYTHSPNKLWAGCKRELRNVNWSLHVICFFIWRYLYNRNPAYSKIWCPRGHPSRKWRAVMLLNFNDWSISHFNTLLSHSLGICRVGFSINITYVHAQRSLDFNTYQVWGEFLAVV